MWRSPGETFSGGSLGDSGSEQGGRRSRETRGVGRPAPGSLGASREQRQLILSPSIPGPGAVLSSAPGPSPHYAPGYGQVAARLLWAREEGTHGEAHVSPRRSTPVPTVPAWHLQLLFPSLLCLSPFLRQSTEHLCCES